MTAPGATATSPWTPQRRRAEALRARHPFAVEVLALYVALRRLSQSLMAIALAIGLVEAVALIVARPAFEMQ